MAQDGHVVIDDREEHFRRQILAVGRRKIDATALSRMVDYVNHESHESINEILPGPNLSVQTAIQEATINFR